jgi:hypothetical protein
MKIYFLSLFFFVTLFSEAQMMTSGDAREIKNKKIIVALKEYI